MKKALKKISYLLIAICLIAFGVLSSSTKSHALATTDSPVELRGVWVATVANIDISKQNGVGAKAISDYKAKLKAIIDRVENYGLNAIFFQVRPANDAFYASNYNPWSEYLVSLGTNPGWDMFTWFIDECHSRGIQVHAWLNPYRVTGSNVINSSMTEEEIKNVKLNYRNNILNVAPNIDSPVTKLDEAEYLKTIVAGKEGKLILNPAKDASINHIKNTIQEIIENYEVDGIHFDDYFYPSGGIETAIDTEDYNAYVANGGTLSKADWRRSNVDRMVEEVHDLISEYNTNHSDHYVAFGISPCAVWAPSSEKCTDGRGQDGGMNVVCGSYSAYNDLYADTRKWVLNEWLDYILPQNYYNFGEEYKEVASWWSQVVSNTSVKLYIGTPLYRTTEFNDALLVHKQFEFNQSLSVTKKNVSGYVLFSYSDLVSSNSLMSQAVKQLIVDWKGGSILPVYKESPEPTSSVDDLEVNIYDISGNYSVQFKELPGINGYVIYAISNGYDIDFTSSNTYIGKVFNKVGEGTKHIYKVTEKGSQINQFVIRLFDMNNNPVGYKLLDFSQAVENPGATIQAIYDKKDYESGETINLLFNIESPADLPLTVKLYVSHDDKETYLESYDLSLNEDGYYEYNYEPFMEGNHDFKVVVNDTDKEVEYELDTILVGEISDTPDDSGSSNNPAKSGCAFGSSVIGIVMLLGLTFVVIRKKER